MSGPLLDDRERGLESGDAAACARVAAGDKAALKLLYDRYAGRAMAVTFRVLGVFTEAEEVVQETFVQVWRQAGDYDAGRGSVSTWINTIARSRAIDRLRSRATERRTTTAMKAEPEAAAPPPTPLENVELRIVRERVQAALAELPGDQRVAIELAYWKGLSQSEIAGETGEAIGTIKTRIRLAMEKLGDRLGRPQ